MKRFVYLAFPILALLCSCEDAADDYRYPSVVTDYTCLMTDADGKPELLRLDNGRTYPIAFTDEYMEAYGQPSTYKSDTAYRVISTYELRDDSVAYTYSMAQVVSVVPTPLREGEALHQDPAYLQSCWLSGGYLNMVIELKALNGKHYIGFVDTTPEGMQGKEFTFYHHANKDVESYRQKLYASIPLDQSLQKGDTVRLVINLYDKGITRQEFSM